MSTDVSLPDRDRDTMLAMITGYMRAQAVYVAAKLRIADQLAAGPKTVESLAADTASHAPSLYRLLRALASEGVFQEHEAGVFALTPMAELLRSDTPDSIRIWAIMFNEESYEAWADLLASIRTGDIAFNRVFGEDYFGYLARHPESNDTFNRAMTSGAAEHGRALLATYDFAPFDVIVDIGGGSGRLLGTILTANSHARGILFDQPHVIEDAATGIELRDVADRCEAVGGDFLEEVPAGGDLYLLRAIVHDWDDDRAATILRNCRRVMKHDGRLLILEAVVAPANEPDFQKWMDLHVLSLLGGRERTEAEFRELLEAAGFAMARVIPLPTGHSAIEAEPA